MNRWTPPGHWPPRWPDVTDPAVLRAVAEVPRHLFVPEKYRAEAYEDRPLPIGQGQTISQPYIVALMTQALRLTATSRVLEIGTGSGYQSAILAQITPHVWSVETLAELAATARERLHGLGYPVKVKAGDGRLGWPEHAPYDAVIVTAAAPDVPPALVAQLADDGRLVIPVGEGLWDQRLWLIEKSVGRLRARVLAEVRFVPLVASSSRPEPEDEALAEIRRELNELLNRG
ncbi:MAG: protein-L-isoaspartate O-methyltransferase [Chloroflexi bacterium HGW-Chloroflexi-1]|nr:MAG: protein-L-isoaspartate O-methyltransferase [Chloroflexi bacterium HGW-Chloroflexi-1]